MFTYPEWFAWIYLSQCRLLLVKLEGRRVFLLGNNIAGVVVRRCCTASSALNPERWHVLTHQHTLLCWWTFEVCPGFCLSIWIPTTRGTREESACSWKQQSVFQETPEASLCIFEGYTRKWDTTPHEDVTFSVKLHQWSRWKRIKKQSKEKKRNSSVEMIEGFLKENNCEPKKKSKSYNSRNKSSKGERLI